MAQNKATQLYCHYDPWGNRKLYTDWSATHTSGSFVFDRGFTGHEHVDGFKIINMNARLYDPVIGRFFSPDPQVQSPNSTQSYNRYSYCMNNPIMFNDPDGEFWHIVIGGAVGGVVNLATKALQGKINSFEDGLVAFGIGAVAGAVGAATGGASFIALGGGVGGAGGALAGLVGGGVGTALSSPILAVGNTGYFKDPMMTLPQYALSVAAGGLLGGLTNGITALANGRNFWNGSAKAMPAPAQSLAVTTSTMENTGQTKMTPQQKGREGEMAANLPVGKGKIESATGSAKYRIPDGLDTETKILYEVKNVQYQGYTKQIEDFVIYCRQNDYTFILYIRNETELSKPLENALKLIPAEIKYLHLK